MKRTKPRVLCVDDNQDTCEMIAIALGLSGVEVVLAHSAEEALRLALSDNFDLYLLDGRLPDGTGVDVCSNLRKSGSEAPIIFCSGYGEHFDKQKALSAGADLYLLKPISIENLIKIVPELISNKRPGQRL